MAMKQTHGATLCWSCGHAVPSPATGAGCPWSVAGEPVEGWTAERRDVLSRQDNGVVRTESYLVAACPLYQSEARPQTRDDAVHTKGAKAVRTTKWDTVQAREMLNQGMTIQEIAEAVGATPSAVGCYFRRIQADELRLERALAEAQEEQVKSTVDIKVKATEEGIEAFLAAARETQPGAAGIVADASEALPLTVRDVAEQLATLDSFYPGARLECGAAGGQFHGMEVFMHLRAGREGPDVTVRLL